MNTKVKVISVKQASAKDENKHILKVLIQGEGSEKPQEAMLLTKKSATEKASEGMKKFLRLLLEAANTPMNEDGTTPEAKMMTLNLGTSIKEGLEPQLFIQAEDYRITDIDSFLEDM